MIRFVTGLLVVAVLAVTGPAAAQQTTTPAKAVPGLIALSLNKAMIFDLPVDARDVLVANPEIADVVIKTPRRAYVLGQGIGDTNGYFFDEQGSEILRLEVRVELDLSGLRSVLAEVLPNERIKVTAANQNIILTGSVRSAKAAEDARLVARRFVADDAEIVNLLGIGSVQQVLLRVRIAEMQRSIVKELGFNTQLRSVLKPTPHVFDLRSGKQEAFGLGIAQAAFPNTFGLLDLDFLSLGIFDALEVLIDVLERQGLVKTLAEPTLIAVSGENANFLVGGEFPVPSGLDNSGNIKIEFKQFGVVLTFTPVVLESGLISLKISTEVSALSFETQIVLQGVTVPGLAINRAETTVELPSGGTLVIAGLLQDDIIDTIEGIPGLKDIPVLGALFRSTAFKKKETELVVTVTPYLVRSVNEQSISLPTDGFAPASDFDRYLLGRLYKVYAKPKQTDQWPPVGRLLGPVGYIME